MAHSNTFHSYFFKLMDISSDLRDKLRFVSSSNSSSKQEKQEDAIREVQSRSLSELMESRPEHFDDKNTYSLGQALSELISPSSDAVEETSSLQYKRISSTSLSAVDFEIRNKGVESALWCFKGLERKVTRLFSAKTKDLEIESIHALFLMRWILMHPIGGISGDLGKWMKKAFDPQMVYFEKFKKLRLVLLRGLAFSCLRGEGIDLTDFSDIFCRSVLPIQENNVSVYLMSLCDVFVCSGFFSVMKKGLEMLSEIFRGQNVIKSKALRFLSEKCSTDFVSDNRAFVTHHAVQNRLLKGFVENVERPPLKWLSKALKCKSWNAFGSFELLNNLIDGNHWEDIFVKEIILCFLYEKRWRNAGKDAIVDLKESTWIEDCLSNPIGTTVLEIAQSEPYLEDSVILELFRALGKENLHLFTSWSRIPPEHSIATFDLLQIENLQWMYNTLLSADKADVFEEILIHIAFSPSPPESILSFISAQSSIFSCTLNCRRLYALCICHLQSNPESSTYSKLLNSFSSLSFQDENDFVLQKAISLQNTSSSTFERLLPLLMVAAKPALFLDESQPLPSLLFAYLEGEGESVELRQFSTNLFMRFPLKRFVDIASKNLSHTPPTPRILSILYISLQHLAFAQPSSHKDIFKALQSVSQTFRHLWAYPMTPKVKSGLIEYFAFWIDISMQNIQWETQLEDPLLLHALARSLHLKHIQSLPSSHLYPLIDHLLITLFPPFTSDPSNLSLKHKLFANSLSCIDFWTDKRSNLLLAHIKSLPPLEAPRHLRNHFESHVL